MEAIAQLQVMSYGKWSDRFGGPDQPYEYVDLYDSEAGQLLTWSVDHEMDGKRPEAGTLSTVVFSLELESKAALTEIKKGDRKGQTMGYVQQKLKVRVLSFSPPGMIGLPQSKPPARQAAKAA